MYLMIIKRKQKIVDAHYHKNIRIYHEVVDRIDNSVSRVTAWHHEALPSDAKQ